MIHWIVEDRLVHKNLELQWFINYWLVHIVETPHVVKTTHLCQIMCLARIPQWRSTWTGGQHQFYERGFGNAIKKKEQIGPHITTRVRSTREGNVISMSVRGEAGRVPQPLVPGLFQGDTPPPIHVTGPVQTPVPGPTAGGIPQPGQDRGNHPPPPRQDRRASDATPRYKLLEEWADVHYNDPPNAEEVRFQTI